MNHPYCSSLNKIVSANKVRLGVVSRSSHFYCPKCKEIVIFRDWPNADPYFAHKKYNKYCPLSVKGDGDLFNDNRYEYNPFNGCLDDYQE